MTERCGPRACLQSCRTAVLFWTALRRGGYLTLLFGLVSRGLYQHGQNIAPGTVQHAVGSGAQQQSETLAAVAADNDQIRVFLAGQIAQLRGGLSHQYMLVFDRVLYQLAQALQLLLRLELKLLLNLGKINRHVAAVGEGEWLDHMGQTEAGAAGTSQVGGSRQHFR